MPPGQLQTIFTQRRTAVLAAAERQNGAEGLSVIVSVPRLQAPLSSIEPTPSRGPPTSVTRKHPATQACGTRGRHFCALTSRGHAGPPHTRLARTSGPHGAEVISIPVLSMTEASKVTQHDQAPPRRACVTPAHSQPPESTSNSRALESSPPLDFLFPPLVTGLPAAPMVYGCAPHSRLLAGLPCCPVSAFPTLPRCPLEGKTSPVPAPEPSVGGARGRPSRALTANCAAGTHEKRRPLEAKQLPGLPTCTAGQGDPQAPRSCLL